MPEEETFIFGDAELEIAGEKDGMVSITLESDSVGNCGGGVCLPGQARLTIEQAKKVVLALKKIIRIVSLEDLDAHLDATA